jgi:RNA polymerase sigma factor (sigma-70 family)
MTDHLIGLIAQAAELAKRDSERTVIDLLLADLERYPPLEPDENNALIARAQAGDAEAFQLAVAHNAKLVMATAMRLRRERTIPLADAFQEGAIGLMRAVELFDCESGYRFSTFATWHIAARILRADAQQGLTIHTPVHVQDKARRAKRLGEEPQWQEPIIAYLSEPYDPHDAKSEDLSQHLPDPDATVDSERLEREELLVKLINRARLSGRELAVIALRYGLGGHEPHTLLATAKRMMPLIGVKRVGLSRERVRQIESKALEKLRRAATHSRDRDALLALVA